MNATLTPTEATTLPSPACGGGEFATLAFLQMIERAARDPSIDIDKLDRLLLMGAGKRPRGRANLQRGDGRCASRDGAHPLRQQQRSDP
jgi:hypothetical protein